MTSPSTTSTPNQFRNGWNDLAWLLDIEPNAKFVLLALIKHANWDDGSRCFPSLARLALHTRLSDRTVRRAVRHLEDLQILKCISHPGYSNEYSFADLEDVRTRLLTPDTQSPLTHSHPCPAVTPVTMSGEVGHNVRGGRTESPGRADTVSADHSQRTESENKIREQEAAATRTHEGERTAAPREAAAAAPKGQDFDLDQPKAAAAASRVGAQTSTAASQDEPSEELVVWLGTTIKERVAGLVQTPGEVKRGQVKPALRTLKRWADRDESKVRAYLADELDRQEGRDDHEKARTVGKLIEWLADKRSWATWRDAAPSAVSLTGGKPIHRGRPPRPGMVWNDHINDWTNATAIHTGLFKRINLGSDDDDIVYDPTAAAAGVQR